MFKRRKPLPIIHRLWEVLWPRGGWSRFTRYVGHRVGRLPGTPYQIAAGLACGAAISFTPFMGFHFVGAALLCVLIRGNVIASAIGTVVGNPWTFPFIWLWIHSLGTWVLGQSGDSQLPAHLSMQDIFQNLSGVFLPMTVGGVPTAILVWIAVFWSARVAVAQYQRQRRRRLRRKVMKRKEREAATRYMGREAEGER